MQLMYGEGVKRAVRFQNESQIEPLPIPEPVLYVKLGSPVHLYFAVSPPSSGKWQGGLRHKAAKSAGFRGRGWRIASLHIQICNQCKHASIYSQARQRHT